MGVINLFDANASTAINQAAKAKERWPRPRPCLTDIADVYFQDGSHGDWAETLNRAIEIALTYPENTDVWCICPVGTTYWFFGSEVDVLAKINSLP